MHARPSRLAPIGRIAPGYLADFVVFSEDLLAIDPVRIPDVQVLRTVVVGHDAFMKSSP
jgi:predicted amidohydrolase YtcJ